VSVCFKCEVPNVAARIKQVDSLTAFGVNADKIARLVQIALRTTPAEILKLTTPAVHASDDVVNVKRPLVSEIW